MAAVICILDPFSLSIPASPVPISLSTLGIYFVMTVLGMKLGTISVLAYILLGLVGSLYLPALRPAPASFLAPLAATSSTTCSWL